MNVPHGQDPVDALLHEARLDPAEAAALADLLHAVDRGAGRLPAGTPGEFAALAAFRNAHRETATQPLGAFAMYRNRTRAALLTAKTAAAALVLVSAGGVAVAATTGTIPTPLTSPSHPAHPVTPKPSDDAADHDANDDNGAADPASHDATDNHGGLRDTCADVASGKFTDPTAAASNKDYRKLVIAAGGQDKVTAFCAALPATDGQGEDHGNSANAPGHDPNGPGNSENAPGHDPSGPGNSENAPGHNKGKGNSQNEDSSGPGNSENAPGHNKSGKGNSANAPGHDPSGPGNSENAPGHNKSGSDNSGQGQSGDDQGEDSGNSGHGNSGHGGGND
jgi:hypothetical protein